MGAQLWEQQLGTEPSDLGLSEVTISKTAKGHCHAEALGAEVTRGRPKAALWHTMQVLLHVALRAEAGAVVAHTSLLPKPAQLNQLSVE